MDNLSLTKELDRFYYLWRESIAIYEDWAKQQGLSNNVVMVMESIYSNRENCTPSSISHKWFIPKQTEIRFCMVGKQSFRTLSGSNASGNLSDPSVTCI